MGCVHPASNPQKRGAHAPARCQRLGPIAETAKVEACRQSSYKYGWTMDVPSPCLDSLVQSPSTPSRWQAHQKMGRGCGEAGRWRLANSCARFWSLGSRLSRIHLRSALARSTRGTRQTCQRCGAPRAAALRVRLQASGFRAGLYIYSYLHMTSYNISKQMKRSRLVTVS